MKKTIAKRNHLTIMNLLFFQDTIYTFYLEQARLFPWRQTTDPYYILVSEIMLQQTQTSRVLGRYEEFIGAFPDIVSLAEAELNAVLLVWQGLGYNRRALNLKKIAEIVLNDFQGRLPESYDELMTLPGIGHATAGSILAFAFNKPVPFIETNIRRVFIHFFFQDRQGITDKEILPFVEETLDRDNPRQWYYALMDYGAMLAKSVPNPNRKSAHYSKQTKFEDSDRQIRGMIVKMLVTESPVMEKKLIETLGKETSRVKHILAELVNEGFIVRDRTSIRIA